MKFNLKRPCKDCPFLKSNGYLRRTRAIEIAEVLRNDASFSCHKTVDYSVDSEHRSCEHDSFCAGALVVMDNEDNLFMNVLPRLGALLDDFRPEELRGHDDAFESLEAFIEGHDN